jgi:DNA-binding NtrC family response regulator
MSVLQILVVSSDDARARDLSHPLREAGHQVETAREPITAGPQLLDPGLDAVVVDLTAPGIDREGLGQALGLSTGSALPEPLEAVERRHILATLAFTGGNKRRAASLLGIARSTLIQKVRRYEIRLPDLESD